jgi:hypothetical protein
MIKFSFHYLELKRLSLLEHFVANVNRMRDAGISITVEITPSDELVPYIDELKETCIKYFGALCHVTIARDDRTGGKEILSDYSFDEYKNIWGQFNSELFAYKTSIFYKKRTEFCNAGDWSIVVNLGTGEYRQCYCGDTLGNIYKNPKKKLNLYPIGHGCREPHCYNGHAFLTLGDIPELLSPTYAEVRNRACADGTEWLSPTMKQFISTKLSESNHTRRWGGSNCAA